MTNQLVQIIEKYDMNGFNGRYDSSGRHVGGWGTDKNDWHGFCDYYEENLSEYKDKEVSLLELGTNYGCSAIMWHDFLPNSKMLLLDIQETMNPKCWEIMNNDRFTYANCDAYDFSNVEEVKNLFPEGFDIIFDDGPHTLDSQKKCIEYYLPILKDGGTMFIEDVQKVEDFEELEECFDNVKETLEGKYTFDKVDLRYVKNRYDDLIFAIKRDDS
jgi:cephalosporin hydroxylase